MYFFKAFLKTKFILSYVMTMINFGKLSSNNKTYFLFSKHNYFSAFIGLTIHFLA